MARRTTASDADRGRHAAARAATLPAPAWPHAGALEAPRQDGRGAPLPATTRARSAVFALACALAGAPAAAPAHDSAVTVYGGWRDGGRFSDGAGERLRLAGAPSWAIGIDRGLDGRRQLQFYLSHQRTELALTAAALAAAVPQRPLPLTVTHAHLGGTYFFDGPIGAGPYVVGGLGATLYRPGLAGTGDALRPSLNLGIGHQFALGARLALRAELRGYFTLVDSRGGLFCANGCLVVVHGDGIVQGAAQLGLSYRY